MVTNDFINYPAIFGEEIIGDFILGLFKIE